MLSKRKVAVIVFVLLVATVSSVMFTVAMLTDKRETVNTFTFGDVKVTLTEQVSNNRVLSPGSVVTRKPVVTGQGVECYVRAVVTVSDHVDNNQSVMEFIEFSQLGNGWYVLESGEEGVWNQSNEVIVYYDTYLAKDQESSELFEGFTLLVANEEQQALLEGANSGFDVNVVIEAVQASVAGTYFEKPEDAFVGVDVLQASR